MKRVFLYSCLMLVSLMGHAQLDIDVDSGQGEKGSKVRNLLGKAKDFADARSKKDVDTLYIENPDRPWRVSLDSYLSQSDLNMKSIIPSKKNYFGDFEGDVKCNPRIRTDVSTSVGVRVGYKGFAVHYAFNVAGEKGRDLSVSSSGTWYCAHLRLHEFKTKEPVVRLDGTIEEDEYYNPQWDPRNPKKWPLDSPIKARTVVADGYYIFNKRRFSYKAAYRQSVIQKRSAGSWLIGAMFYYSDFRYDDLANAELILNMNNVGRVKQWQANVGAGYGYNFVPAKGWLISAMAMPMLTVYNHVDLYNYDSYCLELAKDPNNTKQPSDVPVEERWMKKDRTDKMNSRISLNFNARLSITYNWSRYFACVNGQFYNFRYHHKDHRGNLNDWYANATIGVRL